MSIKTKLSNFMDPLQQFTQTLMKQANLDTLPDATKAGLSEQLEAQVTRRLGAVIINALPDTERDGFVAKMEGDMSEQQRTALMEEAAKLIPNYQQLLEKTLEDVAAEFLSNLKQ